MKNKTIITTVERIILIFKGISTLMNGNQTLFLTGRALVREDPVDYLSLKRFFSKINASIPNYDGRDFEVTSPELVPARAFSLVLIPDTHRDFRKVMAPILRLFYQVKLHTPVSCPSKFCIVIIDRLSLSLSLSCEPVLVNIMFDKVLIDGIGPSL